MQAEPNSFGIAGQSDGPSAGRLDETGCETEAACAAAGRPRAADCDFPRTLARMTGWLLAAAAVSIVVAWIAFQLQQEGIAPAVIFPVVIGAALGYAVASTTRAMRMTLRWPLIVAVAAFALGSIAAQEYFGYVQYCRLYDATTGSNPRMAMARAAFEELGPARFGEFVRARFENDRPGWLLDVTVTPAAAMVALVAGMRHKSNLD